MTDPSLETILHDVTKVFAHNSARVFKDTANAEFTIEPLLPIDSPIAREHGFTAISHFTGRVQGDFIYYMDEITASRIAGVFPPGGSIDEVMKVRDLFSDMICESLNAAANKTVESLKVHYGRLMLLPPAWVFGEYHMMDYVSGIGSLRGACGTVLCSVSVNMVSLKTEVMPSPLRP